MKHVIKLFFFATIVGAFSSDEIDNSGKPVKVLKSTLIPWDADLGNEEAEEVESSAYISGAKLNDSRKVSMRDISICWRFNIRYLGSYLGKSTLVMISDWLENAAQETTNSMLIFGAYHPFTFFEFGHPKANGSWASFLLKDPQRDDYKLWKTNVWNHVCLTYEKDTSHLRVVKVSIIITTLTEMR